MSTKKLVNSPLSNKIYWATVNEEKGMITGNREDVTDNAIAVVLEHLISMDRFRNEGFSGYTYDAKDGGTRTIAAYDESHVTVSRKLFDELKEYKEKYKSLCK